MKLFLFFIILLLPSALAISLGASPSHMDVLVKENTFTIFNPNKEKVTVQISTTNKRIDFSSKELTIKPESTSSVKFILKEYSTEPESYIFIQPKGKTVLPMLGIKLKFDQSLVDSSKPEAIIKGIEKPTITGAIIGIKDKVSWSAGILLISIIAGLFALRKFNKLKVNKSKSTDNDKLETSNGG